MTPAKTTVANRPVGRKLKNTLKQYLESWFDFYFISCVWFVYQTLDSETKLPIFKNNYENNKKRLEIQPQNGRITATELLHDMSRDGGY